MDKARIGFGMTGSFCTWEKVLPVMKRLTETYEVIPILSPISCVSENRFGKAADWIAEIEETCGRKIWNSIEQVEPIGPKKLLDAMLIVPCTGNTLGKLANGINDTAVTMASKSTLRNSRPLVIAVSTNDALGASARNIGILLNARNIYFVPMKQDDPIKKPTSMVACFDQVEPTLKAALDHQQFQPLF